MAAEILSIDTVAGCPNSAKSDEDFVQAVMAPKATSDNCFSGQDMGLNMDVTMDTVVTISDIGRKRALSDGEKFGECNLKKLKSFPLQKNDDALIELPVRVPDVGHDRVSTSLESESVTGIGHADRHIAKGRRVCDNVCDGTRNSQVESVDTCRILKAIESLGQSFKVDLANLEQKLTNKMLKTVQIEIDNVREEFSGIVGDMVSRVQQLEDKSSSLESADVGLNFILRNVPEGKSENIVNKINGILTDGLKLRDVKIEHAARKQSYKRGQPGLVIAKCKNSEDKEKIMSAKRILADSRNYRDISISHDKTRDQRLQEANWRTVISAVGKDKLALRGPRVILKNDSFGGREREGRSGDHRPRSLFPCLFDSRRSSAEGGAQRDSAENRRPVREDREYRSRSQGIAGNGNYADRTEHGSRLSGHASGSQGHNSRNEWHTVQRGRQNNGASSGSGHGQKR